MEELSFPISLTIKSNEGVINLIVVSEAVIVFNPGISLIAETANKDTIGRIESGDLPIKTNKAQTITTADMVITSKASRGVEVIR